MARQHSRLNVKIKTKVRHSYFKRRQAEQRLEEHESRQGEAHSYKITIENKQVCSRHSHKYHNYILR